MFRRLLAFALFAGCVAGQARADLVLEYQGTTDQNSSLNGVSIAPGTSYDIKADFSTPALGASPFGYIYSVNSIAVDIGGTSYSEMSPTNFSVLMFSPAQGAPVYAAGLLNFGAGTGAYPIFSGSSNTGFDASAPTPTVFSGYSGLALGSGAFSFTTAAGPLVLDFDTSTGIGASINAAAVPEPSSAAVCAGITALAGLCTWARRRRAKVAG